MNDMTTFFEEMTEILETDEPVTAEHTFGDEWDSLAIVSTIALVDEKFGVFLEGKDLGECKTVQSVLDLVAKQAT